MKETELEFTRLVKEYEREILAICYLYSQNSEDAKDLRQDVLVNLWKGLPRFRGDSSRRTWMTRIAINTCISFKRKKKVEVVDESFLPRLAMESEDAGAQVAFLHERMQKLDYLDRAIVLLWLEDLPYDEIGDIIGISAKNVGVRLVRIKNKLKNVENDEE